MADCAGRFDQRIQQVEDRCFRSRVERREIAGEGTSLLRQAVGQILSGSRYFSIVSDFTWVPRHQPNSEQFNYCMSGALQFQVGGEEMILRAGELVEIPSNVPHEA